MKGKTSKLGWVLLVGAPLGALLLSFWGVVFAVPDMELVNLPEMKVAFMDYTGSYRKSPDVLIQALGAAPELHCQQVWGQYLDIPLFVSEDKQRARLGCMVEDFPTPMPAGFQQRVIAPHFYIKARRHAISSFVSARINIFMLIFAARHQVMQDGYIVELYDHHADQPGEGTVLMPVSSAID